MATSDRVETLRRLYAAFNARDIETVLSQMHPSVEWWNVAEGGVMHGPGAVREYWHEQFLTTDPHVEPLAIDEERGEVTVRVHQRVRDVKTGAVLAEGEVLHVYRFEGDQIASMIVRQP